MIKLFEQINKIKIQYFQIQRTSKNIPTNLMKKVKKRSNKLYLFFFLKKKRLELQVMSPFY